MHIFPYKAVFLGGETKKKKPSQSRTILENYQSRGIPTFCIGTGVANPEFWTKTSKWNDTRKEWNNTISNFSLVGVRGPNSKSLLDKAGIKRTLIVGDTALILATEKYIKKRKNRIIGLNIGTTKGKMWGGEEEFLGKIEFIISALLQEGFKIKLLPVWSEDYEINEMVFQKICHNNLSLINCFNNFEKYYDEVEQCDIFIGEKLHSTVIACMTRTPCIMIEYRPKCLDFMKSIGMEKYNIKTDNISKEKIFNMIENIYKNTEQIQVLLEQEIRKYKKKLVTFSQRVKNE